ncbi:MAG: hypothetical protein IJ558_02270 [Treponema sp.]|nr:hypothetical protein [Treponema sp.]
MKKKWFVFTSIVALCVMVAFVSCSDISNSSTGEPSSASSEQNFTVSGTLSLANSSRAAFPSKLPYSLDSLSYQIYASKIDNTASPSQQGTIEKQSDGTLAYTVTLTTQGTWLISADAFITDGSSDDSAQKTVFSGRAEYSTGSKTAPVIMLEPSFFDTDDDEISVSLALSFALENYTVSKIEYMLDAGWSDGSNRTTIPVTGDSALLEAHAISGTNRLWLFFYDASGVLLYFCRESICVISNTVTDTWCGTSKHFVTDGTGTTRFVLTDDCINTFISKAYYVSQSYGDDSNSGSSGSPVKTLKCALDRILSINDGESDYSITLVDAVTDDSKDAYTAQNHYSFISIDPGEKPLHLSLNVQWSAPDTSAVAGNGTGRVFYIGANADVVFFDIRIFSGGSATSGTCDRGGGVYVANGGKLTLNYGSEIRENAATLTGSEDAYVEAGGTLCLLDSSRIANLYLEKDAVLWTGTHTNDEMTITVSDYDDTSLVWLKFIERIENENGTQVVEEITDENTINWMLEKITAATVSSSDGEDRHFIFTAEGTLYEQKNHSGTIQSFTIDKITFSYTFENKVVPDSWTDEDGNVHESTYGQGVLTMTATDESGNDITDAINWGYELFASGDQYDSNYSGENTFSVQYLDDKMTYQLVVMGTYKYVTYDHTFTLTLSLDDSGIATYVIE